MHPESIACFRNNICEAQTQFRWTGSCTMLPPVFVKISCYRICINTAIKQRHICPITTQVFAKTLWLWESSQCFQIPGAWFCGQGLWFAMMPNTSPQVPLCTFVSFCMCVCVCVCDTQRRGLGLLHWHAEVWWWMNGTPDVYQYLAVNIPGRRGDEAAENMRWCSWEHEVVQQWTVDFQFNWLNWKVKPLWSWQCQPQLWHFAVSDVLKVGYISLMILAEKYTGFFKRAGHLKSSYPWISCPHTCNSCVSWSVYRNKGLKSRKCFW